MIICIVRFRDLFAWHRPVPFSGLHHDPADAVGTLEDIAFKLTLPIHLHCTQLAVKWLVLFLDLYYASYSHSLINVLYMYVSYFGQ